MALPFVVYVNYPNGSKEYAYLCHDPKVKQGSTVYNARGVACSVVRTADSDPLALRTVWSQRQPLCPPRALAPSATEYLKKELQKKLNQLIHQDAKMRQWTELAKRNPEAKKLLSELKGLL